MLGEVGFVVAAGVQMKFVRDAARGQQLMERLRAHVETVVVLGAAIEIDAHPGGAWEIANDGERAVALPEGGIEWIAERSAQGEGERVLLCAGHLNARQVGNQCGAMRADRTEELRIPEGETQRAVASHRDAGD